MKKASFKIERHYLQDELYGLISEDPSIFDFLRNGILDGLWYWDIEHPEHEWMDDKFWQVLGYDPELKKPFSKEWQQLVHQGDLKVALKNFHAHCADPSKPYDQIVRYRHADGRTVWIRCRGVAIRDSKGKAIRMLGVHNDVTALKEAEAQLKMEASHDSLTHLYNRRALDEHLEWILLNARRNSEFLSVGIIDIDHFKRINDTHGHLKGDAVLVTVASTLLKACRENDFLARFGGEEFVVVFSGANKEQAIKTADRLRVAVSNSVTQDLEVTVSIGLSTFNPKLSSFQNVGMQKAHLLTKADEALYLAKDQGRNRIIHVENI